MYSRRSLLISWVCLVVFSVAAYASPPDQTVSYRIYIDPTNPQLGAKFTVILRLSAGTTSGSSVGWEIDEAKVVQHASGSNPSRKWGDSAPTVGTSDGRWWITHADPESPVLSEFTVPPSISGVAAPNDSEESDLEYSILGRVYVPPPTGPHFAITAALDYVFAAADGGDPDEEDDDEPGEMGDFEDAERPAGVPGLGWAPEAR